MNRLNNGEFVTLCLHGGTALSGEVVSNSGDWVTVRILGPGAMSGTTLAVSWNYVVAFTPGERSKKALEGSALAADWWKKNYPAPG